MELVVCNACRRHVRASDALCPFCGSAVPTSSVPATVDAVGLCRARRYALGAAIAVGSAGAAGLIATACKGGEPGHPHVVVVEPLDAATAPVGVTDPDPFPASSHSASPPPPPPTNTADLPDPDPRWRRRSNPCVQGSSGKLICPPYGCVFPDDACDVVSA